MRRNIILLSWFHFFIDFIFYAPVAVLYFAYVSGSYALGMSIFSVVWISSALFELPTGIFSDMIGRKNTIVAGAICSLFSVIFYAIGGNYWWLVAGALLEGVGRSFYSGNNDALLHDTLAQSNAQASYSGFFGTFNSYNQIGCAVVAIVGSIMASISYPLVMWASLFPRVILVVLALSIVEPSVYITKSTNIFSHLGESFLQFRQNRTLRLLTIVSAMRTAVYEGAYQFRTAFVATLWPLWAVGIAKTISHVGGALSFHFSERILNTYGYKRVLVFEIIINRIINLTALLFPTVASPALMGTTSLMYGVTTTAVNTMLQNEFTAKQRATLGSLSSLFGSIAFSIVVVVLGFIADKTNPAFALIIAHVSILSILYFYKKIFTKST